LLFVFKVGGGFDAGDDGLHPIAGETAGGVVLYADVTDFAGVFGADHGVGEERLILAAVSFVLVALLVEAILDLNIHMANIQTFFTVCEAKRSFDFNIC